jgi:hypothetical protein
MAPLIFGLRERERASHFFPLTRRKENCGLILGNLCSLRYENNTQTSITWNSPNRPPHPSCRVVHHIYIISFCLFCSIVYIEFYILKKGKKRRKNKIKLHVGGLSMEYQPHAKLSCDDFSLQYIYVV